MHIEQGSPDHQDVTGQGHRRRIRADLAIRQFGAAGCVTIEVAYHAARCSGLPHHHHAGHASASRIKADYSNEGRRNRPTVGTIPEPKKTGGGGAASRERAFVSNSFDQATIAALRAMEATDTNKLRELNLALTGLFELQRETRGDPAGRRPSPRCARRSRR